MVTIQSFGFKYGLPTISDYLMDARVLINPFYVDDLRDLTGNDKAVADYIMADKKTKDYLEHMENMLDFVVKEIMGNGKSQVVISIGCTGGRHRSVFTANHIARHLNSLGIDAKAIHRDIDK